MRQRVLAFDMVFTVSYISEYKSCRKNLEIHPKDFSTNLVVWGPNPSQYAVIQKSGNLDTDWITLGYVAEEGPAFFLDNIANNSFHRYGVEYYRVLYPMSKELLGPRSIYAKQEFQGLEITRRHRVRLEKMDGNKVYYLARLRGGPRCPRCWDSIMEKRTDAVCPICFGTGFTGGYADPIVTYVNMGAEQSTEDTQIDGPANKQNTIQGWTSNLPLLYTGDVLIEPASHFVWEIVPVGVSTFRRVVTRQTFSAQRMTQDDNAEMLIQRISALNDKNLEVAWK